VHRRKSPTSLLILSVALLPLAGACSAARPAGGGIGQSAAEAEESQSSLLPQAVAVHPLTRLGNDAKGEPALLAHIELLDRFGHSTKALGTLLISIDPPRGPRWEVDLTPPDTNALLFDDLVTRTYALTLSGIPDELAAWGAHRDSRIASPPVISVEFIGIELNGRQSLLRTQSRVVR